MKEKEISIQFMELGRMEIYCRKCGMGFIIDLTRQHAFPAECSACMARFPDAACAAMTAYQKFYQKAVESEMRFEFRIKAG